MPIKIGDERTWPNTATRHPGRDVRTGRRAECPHGTRDDVRSLRSLQHPVDARDLTPPDRGIDQRTCNRNTSDERSPPAARNLRSAGTAHESSLVCAATRPIEHDDKKKKRVPPGHPLLHLFRLCCVPRDVCVQAVRSPIVRHVGAVPHRPASMYNVNIR